MKSNFGNNSPVLNLYNKSNLKSKIDTQLLYGDNFRVIKKTKKTTKSKFPKVDIIFWKGHVAVALSNRKIIHAYGPMKKVVIMDIKKAIERIERTAKLKVTSIKRI